MINLKTKISFGLVLLFFLFSCQFVLRLKNITKNALPSKINSIRMQLIEIPVGSYQMGCSNADPSCDEDEIPGKKIEITKPFYLGKYEVTKGEFSIFVSEKSYKTEAETLGFANTWKDCQGIKQSANHPVICLSWNDAIEFTKWLSEKEGLKYRLPKEAEWEYAARADFFTRYYWGMDMDDSYAWYNKNSLRKTNPVGIKKPNSWGLYDMAGNVWEWCEDDYDKDFFKKTANQNPADLKSGKIKVLRGGSWFDSYLMLRVSTRAFAPKESRENTYGFRVVLEK